MIKIYLKPARMAPHQRFDLAGRRIWPEHVKSDADKQKWMGETAAFECPKCGGVVEAVSMKAWHCLDCDFSEENQQTNRFSKVE